MANQFIYFIKRIKAKPLKRAMLIADDDLKDSTRCTNQWEADKLQHLAMDGNELEACGDAC